MVYWLYILVGVAFAALLGAIVWLLTVIFKEKDAEADATICLNFLANMDNGRFLGVEKSVTPGKNGRLIVEYDAKDVDLNRVLKTKESTTSKVIIPKGKILTLPKGTISKERNVDIFLPIEPEDLHPAVRHSAFGMGMMMTSELKNFEMMAERIAREGSDRKTALLQQIGDGELSRELMNHFEGYVKDFMETTVNLKAKEKATLPSGNLPYNP